MKKQMFLLSVSLILVLLSGCAKPNQVTTVKSPTAGLFYTVELFKNAGPTSDFTRVYAHLERDGKAKKMLVLDGENLAVGKITWNDPHDATLCLESGITDTFHNEVTLIVGDTPEDSETIRNHIDEHCNAGPATAAPTGS
jgi:hypothetical protein